MAVGTTTTLIRMKTETKARLKEYCANNGITQTDFFVRAIEEKLDGRPIVKISQKLMDRLVAQSDKQKKESGILSHVSTIIGSIGIIIHITT
jgi:predicted DNA-binding protein